MALAAEKHENWHNETYNGNPIDLGTKWLEPEPSGPPSIGNIELSFVTSPGTADLSLRCNLARRLLMPGPNRWRCIPDELIDTEPLSALVNVVEASVRRTADPSEFDDVHDVSTMCLDADGTLKSVAMVFHDFDRDRSGLLGALLNHVAGCLGAHSVQSRPSRTAPHDC